MNSSLRGALLWATGLALLVLSVDSHRAHARTRHRYDRRRRVSGYEAKIARFELVMDRFYRGESIEDARNRVNALVEKHNRMVAEGNRETEESSERIERELAPLKKLQERIEKIDGQLERKPSPTDRSAVRQYNALVDQRNARVKQANELNKRLGPKIDAHNALIARVKEEVKASSDRLDAKRKEFDARIDAYEKFHKSEQDLAFFRELNRFYASLHEERRNDGRRGLAAAQLALAVRKVRDLRRELGAWAISDHERRDYGLIVIEAALGGDDPGAGEPCFFIVDTGAMRTTVEPGLVAALGIPLGKETEFRLAGGEKMKGREIVLPLVAVGNVTEKDVEGAAVKASEVGVDGLLGQTFLKRFVYAIDESRPGKLILRPRKKK